MCYNLAMTTNSSKRIEKELYEPIKEYLEKAFTEKFGNCYLETTADGSFSNTLKSVVRHDIIFSFLGKKAAPDLTGFIHTEGSKRIPAEEPSIVQDFITVEIKKERITIQDVYQAKMYGDLFQAKYALLISPERIPEEIRRLDKQLFVTHRYMSGWYLHIGGSLSTLEGEIKIGEIGIMEWFPYPPFPDWIG